MCVCVTSSTGNVHTLAHTSGQVHVRVQWSSGVSVQVCVCGQFVCLSAHYLSLLFIT